MKAFACGDVVPDCQAKWVRPTEEQILRAVAAHAAEVHGLTSVPDELVEQVRLSIVSVG
jgi:predicted small metal-binding protein